jgi:hypothetical protein
MSNEENIEPTVEETVEPTQEELDPDAKTMSLREMSFLLTNQTFTIIAAIGEGLKARYDQLTTGIPPKAKQNQFNKGYIQALNDIAAGLMAYQNEITERGIADGILVREEDVPDLPAPEATATESDESGV